jgi:tetratricopeptide (TPR) repeat protein
MDVGREVAQQTSVWVVQSGDRKMTRKAQSLVWGLLICTLLLEGCSSVETTPGTRGPGTAGTQKPTQQQEADLLEQINRRFENPPAHFQLGQLYHAQQRWDRAEYHYKTALSFDPVMWDAQAATVKLLQDQGQDAKAQLAAEIYMNQVAASAQRSLELGIAFGRQQADDYALACYNQALALRPESKKLQATIYKHIGFHYLQLKDTARAEQYFIRSFNLNGFQQDVALELGRLGVPVEVKKSAKNMKKPGQRAAPGQTDTK